LAFLFKVVVEEKPWEVASKRKIVIADFKKVLGKLIVFNHL
jgi:hypothetical protein